MADIRWKTQALLIREWYNGKPLAYRVEQGHIEWNRGHGKHEGGVLMF